MDDQQESNQLQLKQIPDSSLSKYPKEKLKTLIAFAFATFGLLISTIFLALTHDRVPDRPPLPDIVLDNIKEIPELAKIADTLLMVSAVLASLTVILHRHRWIVARRIFFIVFILYLMRSICFSVTVLPVASDTGYCSPKMNSTSVNVILIRVSELLIGGGLQITGLKNTCGDYIFSGHTIIYVTAYLVIIEYSPKNYNILHWTSFIVSWSGMILLLVSRDHYTVDVLIGYVVSTWVFWVYHILCNNPAFKAKKEENYFSRIWWFPIFQYLEGNVGSNLPREYNLPWSRNTEAKNLELEVPISSRPTIQPSS